MEQKIIYNGEEIKYDLIRSKIKNLYIYIREGKVIVKAPIKMKDKHIYEFINKKAKWIYNNVKKEKEKIKLEEKIEQEDIKKLQLIVKNNIEKYSELLKLKPNKVRIKNLKYAWGSCSSNKNISINIKLANKDEKIIEYVILHEMCHLKYMNHSKNFWSLVEKYIPDYKERKKELKQ